MSLKAYASLILGFITICLNAQSLPDEYTISADGRRLSQGDRQVQGLYNDRLIRRIDLQFDPTNWKSILTQNYDSKTDLAATLTLDGKIYPGVGVRYKGQTSYQRVPTDKKSFNSVAPNEIRNNKANVIGNKITLISFIFFFFRVYNDQ